MVLLQKQIRKILLSSTPAFCKYLPLMFEIQDTCVKKVNTISLFCLFIGRLEFRRSDVPFKLPD